MRSIARYDRESFVRTRASYRQELIRLRKSSRDVAYIVRARAYWAFRSCLELSIVKTYICRILLT